MGVRQQVETAGQTVAGMAAAVLERFDDAGVLLSGARNAAAVYLLGYVVEMKLKQRLAALVGAAGTDRWSASGGLRDQLDSERVALGVAIPYDKEGHHSLVYYGTLLSRALRNRAAMPAKQVNVLLRHVYTVHDSWRVEMRYWPGTVSTETAVAVRKAAEWLMANL